MPAEHVTFRTSDGVTIAATYLRAARPKAAALLLHMMPAAKESWAAFSSALAERGVSSLAIDLRGHGESVMQGEKRLDYHRFSDEEHVKKTLDVVAAMAWLLEREGIGLDRLAACGASIGANLALWAASEHPDLRAALALSPGLDYHGVMADQAAAALHPGQKILLAASEEDAYAYASVGELAKLAAKADVTLLKLKDAGHGTTMFANEPAFMEECLVWLDGCFS